MLEIFEATQTLIAGLALATRNSSARLKIDRERLLSITGAIWSAAEHLNRTSMTENDSLKKTLADDLATLDDALIEARGLLDSADEYDEERVDEDSDEELLTELERRRVERALAILVLARRLVTRVIALLQRPRKPVGDPARIQVYVARLVADQDNLVSSLAGASLYSLALCRCSWARRTTRRRRAAWLRSDVHARRSIARRSRYSDLAARHRSTQR